MIACARAKLVSWSLAKLVTITYLLSSAVENSGFQSSAWTLEEGRKAELVSIFFFLAFLEGAPTSYFPSSLSNKTAPNELGSTPAWAISAKTGARAGRGT